MKNKEAIAFTAGVLGLIAGCSSGGADISVARSSPQQTESGSSSFEADPLLDGALVEGSTQATLPATDAGGCPSLGVPLTLFLTPSFGPEALAGETARSVSKTRCAYVQTLVGPANSWADVAYGVICRGAGAGLPCGAQATRVCSVDLMLKWAESAAPAYASDPTLGFEYAATPQDEPARMALYRRTLREVETLIAESETVLREDAAGSRHCADENEDEMSAQLVDASHAHEEILIRLSAGGGL